MRMLICNKQQLRRQAANSSIYTYNTELSQYENAFLCSNVTTDIVFVDTNHDQSMSNFVNILRTNGIARVDVRKSDELFDILVSSSFIFDYKSSTIYLMDYSYYKEFDLATDQFWAYEELKNAGYKIEYTGYMGRERMKFIGNYFLTNIATDDDIISAYIYDACIIDFKQFLFQKKLERLSHALDFNRLESRVLRHVIYSRSIYNHIVGPRNESAIALLWSNMKFRHYANNLPVAINIMRQGTSKFAERINSQFDIGQYKNMMNFLTVWFRYITVYGKSPDCAYIIGSSPARWLKDIPQHILEKIFTYDPKETEFSLHHFKQLFEISDVKSLSNNSVVYIDIRTDGDRSYSNWEKRRNQVETESMKNMELAQMILKLKRNCIVMYKLTAMDFNIPVNAYFIHFPTTNTRSEFYLLQDELSATEYVTKGNCYYAINNFTSDNVFISPKFHLTKRNKGREVCALYALSNVINIKTDVLQYINQTNKGVYTLRLANDFDLSCTIKFKDGADFLTLPTELRSDDNTLITSHRGALGYYNLCTTHDDKPTGNNHIYIIKNVIKPIDDTYAGHYSISRRSHTVRFSETATKLAGYMFRDLVANGPDYKLSNTDINNSASGHVCNAIIYYRHNYTFDLMNWLRKHAIGTYKIVGGRYEKHAVKEILNAIESAIMFTRLNNDLTGQNYAQQCKDVFNAFVEVD
ncbi:VP3 [Rotavirus F chicken/03V0568/DEU/2003]|uniref:VP3 n=1 Tax=Rotavirus F chicken/03V0568/DEU/2003 TaxID=994994 RepID=M4H253_9REOV|nr:VP3 [Rotavirus F chicken/03V0568/DEU/2003]AFL91885.1 VP3 [Rotavirus F chicken/03V0568/DEU/2003]